jgi:hypothetical protein
MFRLRFQLVFCIVMSLVESMLAVSPALAGNTTGTTRTQTYQPGEPFTGLPGGAPGRGYGAVPSGIPYGRGPAGTPSVYCQNWPGHSSYPQYPGTGPQTPCVQPPNPGKYVWGFLQGVASCLGSVFIAPLQQIWGDGVIYAQFAGALAQGNSEAAARILQLKGVRDRQNFDAFIKSLNPNIYGVDPEEAGRRDGSRLCLFGLIPGVAKGLAEGPALGPRTPGGGTPSEPTVPTRTMPRPLQTPPTPPGMSIPYFGNEVMQWGTGSAAARARIATLTRDWLTQNGVTIDIAEAWMKFYENEVIRNPGNPSAPGRADLMRYAVGLLQGS